MDRERVIVAEILRPRGKRGELLAKSQTDVPDRLSTLKHATARLSTGSDVPIDVDRVWQHGSAWVLKLTGVDSIDSAEKFRHADIWVLPAERGTLPEGEFFEADLIGCEVTDAATGTCLGTIERFQQYGGPPLLEIHRGGRELLIPFVTSICRNIDLSTRQITIEAPEGLLEL